MCPCDGDTDWLCLAPDVTIRRSYCAADRAVFTRGRLGGVERGDHGLRLAPAVLSLSRHATM